MRSRGVPVAIALSALCAAGAVLSIGRAASFRRESDWFLARGNAQAQEFASSLNDAAAEAQLVSFEQRRELVASANQWQRLAMLLILASVMSAFSCYVLYLIARLRQ